MGTVGGASLLCTSRGSLTAGMARIFLTAPALADYILTEEWDPAMPACFRTSEERLRRLREGVDSGVMRAG